MRDLDNDERRVVREALSHLASGHEWSLNQLGGVDRPHSPYKQALARDLATVRRLIRERFQPQPEE